MSIQLSDLNFSWQSDGFHLSISDFKVNSAEAVFIQGASGSGKSTLLGLLSGINQAQSGSLKILDQDLVSMSAVLRDRFRADHIGYIFQQFNLIHYLSVLENVLMGVNFSPRRKKRLGKNIQGEAIRLLEGLGMSEFIHKPVSELSIGQQQRVAAARALLGSPEILICDEPSSALDKVNRDKFIELIKSEAHQNKTTLIFVSHDKDLAKHFDRTIKLSEVCE